MNGVSRLRPNVATIIHDGDLQRFPEYAVHCREEKRWCDLHLKHGARTDPCPMLRIYVQWDDKESVLLVGHMPSHLDSNVSN